MSKGAGSWFGTIASAIRHLLPAWLLFALSAVIDHPLSLVTILLGNTVAMTGVCVAIRFDMEATFARSVARRGSVYFVLLTAYTGFVAAIIAAPAWWLAQDASLPATLAVSAALVVALLALIRIWPAFALPFLWDDAYPRVEENASWLSTALKRSLAFAGHLTRGHDLFLGYGLPASFALLVLAAGGLALAGLGGFLAGDARVAALFVYALLMVPFAHALMANRGLRALLVDARGSRRRGDGPPAEQTTPPVDEHPTVLPAGITRNELNATLLCAVQSAQVNLAIAALERGGDPNASPEPHHRDQRNALMIAVTLPDLRLLRALIAKGADVNKPHGGATALLAATRDSYQGRADAVTMLLANGADPRIADSGGQTPLHHAARCAEPAVAALLIDAGADVDAIDAEGITPLCIACSTANWTVAGFLLDRRARPEQERAQPALLFAAGVHEDDPSGVKLLLRQRANPDVRGALERTPLHAASLAGHACIVEALLAGGATPDLADHRGTTALMEAARSGAVSVIHALGKRKVLGDLADANGRSALIIACQSRHAGEETVRALLSLGADRARIGADGKRALDHAAAAGRWHIVALLDPAYALPSTLGDGLAPPQSASSDHLLDALRFAHWNVAAGFVGVIGEWPESALADLCLDLVDAEHATARCWLYNHGLATGATLADGRTLLDGLVSALPGSAQALVEWLSRGGQPGGAGLVARVLAAGAGAGDTHPARKIAMEMLYRGADAFGCASGQRTALHLAVVLGDSGIIVALLDAGSDPNARDANGRTPLHLACKLDRSHAVAIIRPLLRAGANTEASTNVGETPLGLALARTEPEFSHWLNWNPWRLPNRPLRESDLPLAAAAGDLEAVDRLIEIGLPVDGVDAKGATALIRAAGSGHAALVVRLLGAGAATDHVTTSGIHCLAAAVSAKREAVVRTLLSHGVAPDTPFAGGGTALTIAAALGQVRTAQALLEAGADANATDDAGTTPLQAVAQYAFDSGNSADSRALFDLLLRSGARLDARNRNEQDALLILLGARSPPGSRCDAEHLNRLAEFLLEHGARLDTRDKRGVGLLHACALHGLFGCARLLKANGAPLDQVDAFDRSAADVAGMLGYVDVAALLGASQSPLPSVRQTLRRPARAPD